MVLFFSVGELSEKWAKGKYPSTSAGSMRRLLTTGVTVLFPISNSLMSLSDQGTYPGPISIYSPIRARATKTYSSSPSTSSTGAGSTVSYGESYRLVSSFQLHYHTSLKLGETPLVNGLKLQSRSASSRSGSWNVLLGFGGCGLDFICGLFP